MRYSSYFLFTVSLFATSSIAKAEIFYIQKPLVFWNSSSTKPIHFNKNIQIDIPNSQLIIEDGSCATGKPVSCSIEELTSSTKGTCFVNEFFSSSTSLKSKLKAKIESKADLNKGDWVVSVILPDKLPEISVVADSAQETPMTVDDVLNTTIPKGFLNSTGKVRISITREKASLIDFKALCSMMGTHSGPRLPFEIRVSTGTSVPQKSLKIVMKIPREFREGLPAGSTIVPIIQEINGGENEISDDFMTERGEISADKSELTFTLDKSTFTNKRTVDKSYEAIFVLGTMLQFPSKP